MHGYKTVEEKVGEWNVTARHIQYLCRTGKIPGAIKRAGSWFIPNGAQNPMQNTKTCAKAYNFVGTKNRVFHSAIQLFMSRGFNDVSLRDIANSVGIQQSTIYNHFKSKQEILDVIYDFFCYYYLKDRPSLEDMEAKLQDASLMEIIGAIRYDFKENYAQTMSDIAKIIFQRIGVDARAREISKSLMVDEGIKYVEAVFNIGIASGRFAPFDTRSMAVFINSVRIFTLYIWILDLPPGDMMEFIGDEKKLYEYAARFIKEVDNTKEGG